jgi:hypothetical protein
MLLQLMLKIFSSNFFYVGLPPYLILFLVSLSPALWPSFIIYINTSLSSFISRYSGYIFSQLLKRLPNELLLHSLCHYFHVFQISNGARHINLLCASTHTFFFCLCHLPRIVSLTHLCRQSFCPPYLFSQNPSLFY